MKIEIVFQVLAVVFAVAAAYFLYSGNRDGAFVAAVVGCCSFLLSLRFQAKARNNARDAEREAARTSESSEPQ